MTRRVAVFGGSFDPVHHGHLIAAEEARHALALDLVLFVPAAVPPHKLGASMAHAEHRVAMLRLAIAGNPAFALSRVDLDRTGPHYTVDMLRVLAAELGPGAELFFLMGADSLVDLPTWRDPAGVMAQAQLVVVDRPGYQPDLAALEARLPGLGARLSVVHMPLVGIAASDIEQRVREHRPIRYQVPEAVAAYIAEHGLYRVAEAGSSAGAALSPPPGRPRLLVATANPGKLRELAALLADTGLDLVTPADLGLDLDVAETGTTFAANALLKARAFASASGLPALADDSGLEVDALDGFPGVQSARWVPGTDADRVAALLARLTDVPAPRRTARFRSVAALAWPGGHAETADGQVEGRIAFAPRGDRGFGYDPVFLVEDGGHTGDRTMAELPADEKNRLSHRARALAGLRAALERLG